MAKILAILLIFLACYALWKVMIKIRINRAFQKHQAAYCNMVQGPISQKCPRPVEEVIEEVAAYEQQLFDDVADIFMQDAVAVQHKEEGPMLQEQVLRKMPAKTQTRIADTDLGEWTIYWTFYEQSLEYYVSQYGIFIIHVDREGRESQQRLPLPI